MKRKTVIIALIAVLTFGLIGSTFVFGTSSTTKLQNIESQKSETENELNGIEDEIKKVSKEVDEINEKVEAKQVEINKIRADIENTKKKMQSQENGLNARLRAMYKNGSVGYLEVILGSSNISEFLSNLDMIKRIYESDQETMKVLKKQRDKLVKKEEKVSAEKQELDVLKDKAEAKKETLKTKKDKLSAEIDELNKQADAVRSQIAAMQDKDAKYKGGKFTWPVPSSYQITSPFGYRMHPVLKVWKGHTGVDIGVASGSNIVAAASGTVIIASWYGGYGNAVVIDHGSGISTLYGHNSSLKVSVGQKVSKGQSIAVSGSTGISTGPHCHFEVRINGDYVDPMKYF